jgi:hypothetical protein
MATPAPDTPVADAINRVLEAEHATAQAIAAAQAAAQVAIEAARERRRTILETARQRVIKLHERAQVQLAAEIARLDTSAHDGELDDAGLRDVAAAAVARLAARLTTDTTG